MLLLVLLLLLFVPEVFTVTLIVPQLLVSVAEQIVTEAVVFSVAVVEKTALLLVI